MKKEIETFFEEVRKSIAKMPKRPPIIVKEGKITGIKLNSAMIEKLSEPRYAKTIDDENYINFLMGTRVYRDDTVSKPTFIVEGEIDTESKVIRDTKPSEAIKCIERLKQTIDMAENFYDTPYEDEDMFAAVQEDVDTIKQSLLKAQVLEEKNNILLGQNDDLYDELLLANKQYKELMEYTKQHDKILKIIRYKCVDNINLGLVEHCVSYESYKLCSQNNMNVNDNIEKENLLTKDEFDTLKNYVLVLKP